MSMKSMRMSAEAAQSAKLRKLGAYGSLKMAKKGEDAPRKYASGGSVDMGPVDGGPAKRNLGKPGRKMKGKDKKAGTNVNVVIMPSGGKPDMPMPGPMAGPMPPPDAPMPMPPPGPGPGAPPMAMRRAGGKVGDYKTGGRVKREDGGRTVISEDSKREAKRLSSDAGNDLVKAIGSGAMAGVAGLGSMLPGPGKLVGKGLAAANAGFAAKSLYDRAAKMKEADRIEKGFVKEGEEDRKRGGSVKKRASGGKVHEDEAEDKKLIRSMVKKDDIKPSMRRAKGGKAC